MTIQLDYAQLRDIISALGTTFWEDLFFIFVGAFIGWLASYLTTKYTFKEERKREIKKEIVNSFLEYLSLMKVYSTYYNDFNATQQNIENKKIIK